MNFENILELVEDPKLKDPIKKLLEFEHSNLHLKAPKFSDFYNQVIEEAANEDK